MCDRIIMPDGMEITSIMIPITSLNEIKNDMQKVTENINVEEIMLNSRMIGRLSLEDMVIKHMGK